MSVDATSTMSAATGRGKRHVGAMRFFSYHTNATMMPMKYDGARPHGTSNASRWKRAAASPSHVLGLHSFWYACVPAQLMQPMMIVSVSRMEKALPATPPRE